MIHEANRKAPSPRPILSVAATAMLVAWRAQGTAWQVWADRAATAGLAIAAVLSVPAQPPRRAYRLRRQVGA